VKIVARLGPDGEQNDIRDVISFRRSLEPLPGLLAEEIAESLECRVIGITTAPSAP
jgi:hypothetical protein